MIKQLLLKNHSLKSIIHVKGNINWNRIRSETKRKQTKQTRSKEQKNLKHWWWSTGMEKHAMKQGEKHSSEMKGKYWKKDGNAGWAWRNGRNWIPRQRNWAPSWWVKCCNNPILIIRESHLCYLFNFLLLCKYRDSCFPFDTIIFVEKLSKLPFERSAELTRSLNILSDRSFRFKTRKAFHSSPWI